MNINDYTKEDLYNILDLENPSLNEIKIKIDLLKNTLFKNKNNIKNFLSNIEKKLLEEKNTIEEFSNQILYKDNNKEYDFEEKTMKDSTSLLKNLNNNNNNNDFKETENIFKELNEYDDEDENKDNYSNNNINLDINDYTKEDLYNILELENPTSNEIKIKIDLLKNTTFKEKNNVKKFLSDIEEKLLEEINYIEQFTNLNLYKENNNIENNYEVKNEEEYNGEEYNEEEYNEEEYNEEEYNGEEYNGENIDGENIDGVNIDGENIDGENIYEELKDIENNKIEKYTSNDLSIINDRNHYYYHFNTKYRDNNILSKSTNCEFTIPQTNNVIELRLGSINNLKKPYLINEEKNNNKFCIKIYKNNSNVEERLITLDESYYELLSELKDEINEKLEDISFISYNIKKNNKSEFILNNDNGNDIIHVEIDFKKYYVEPYSLGNILGFENKIYKLFSGNKIISEKLINNTENNLYFCLDEYQSNIIETHKILSKNNIINNKVLAKINGKLGNSTNNYTINENYSNTITRIDGIRKYTGETNLLKIKIKIIDNYNNIIESYNDYMFTLEFIIIEKSLSKIIIKNKKLIK